MDVGGEGIGCGVVGCRDSVVFRVLCRPFVRLDDAKRIEG